MSMSLEWHSVLARRNESISPSQQDLSVGFLLCEPRVNGVCPRLDADIAGTGVLSSIIISCIGTVITSVVAQVLIDIRRKYAEKPRIKDIDIYLRFFNDFVLDLGDQQLITAFAVLISSWAKSGVNIKGAHARLTIGICTLCLTAFSSTGPTYATRTLRRRSMTPLKLFLALVLEAALLIMTWFFNANHDTYSRFYSLGAVIILSFFQLSLWTMISLDYGVGFGVLAFQVLALSYLWAVGERRVMTPLEHAVNWDPEGGVWMFLPAFLWALIKRPVIGLVTIIIIPGAMWLTLMGGSGLILVPLAEVDEIEKQELGVALGVNDTETGLFSEQSIHTPITLRPKTLGRIFFFITSLALALTFVLYQRFGRINHDIYPNLCAMPDFVADKWSSGQALAVLLLALPIMNLLQAMIAARAEAREDRIKPTDEIETKYHDEAQQGLEVSADWVSAKQSLHSTDVQTEYASARQSIGDSIAQTKYASIRENLDGSTKRKSPEPFVELAETIGSTKASEASQAAETSQPHEASQIIDERVLSIFEADFPHGFTIIPTDGSGLLCGLRAVVNTLGAMHPKLPQPTTQQLLNLFHNDMFQQLQAQFDLSNDNNFHVDQIGAILQSWGETFHDLPLQVGAIVEDGGTFLVPYMGTKEPTIVWIHNARAGETMRHFSGVKPREASSTTEQVPLASQQETMGVLRAKAPRESPAKRARRRAARRKTVLSGIRVRERELESQHSFGEQATSIPLQELPLIHLKKDV